MAQVRPQKRLAGVSEAYGEDQQVDIVSARFPVGAVEGEDNDYTDPEQLNLADCVAALPSLRPMSGIAEIAGYRRAAGAETSHIATAEEGAANTGLRKKAGTMIGGGTTAIQLCVKLCYEKGKRGQKRAFAGNAPEPGREALNNEKAPKTSGFRGDLVGSPGWIRTSDLRINSPRKKQHNPDINQGGTGPPPGASVSPSVSPHPITPSSLDDLALVVARWNTLPPYLRTLIVKIITME